MLTVLHRESDGTENYFEAERVYRLPPDGEESVPPLGKIFALGVDTDSSPNNKIELHIDQPFGAVFVMNRYGATVARYTS